MGPSKDAFAVCGAIFFAVLALVLCQSTIWPVKELTVIALFLGAGSQWVAQDDTSPMWIASRVMAYLAMFLVFLAVISYLTW